MKRFLSVLLALMMIFSTAIFAAPTMVSTADTSAEAVEEVGAETQAVVLDESTPTDYDENYGYLVASMDFDNVEVGTEFAIGGLHSITTNNLGVISDTIPEDLGLSKNFYLHIGGYGSGNWKATVEGDDSNKYLTLSVVSNDKTAGLGAGAEIGRRTVLISTDHNTNSLLPEGEYTLVFDQKHDATRSKNTNTMNSPIRACNWIGYLNEYYGISNPETYTTLADGTSRCVAIANKPHDESFTGYLAFGPAPAPGLVGDNGSDFAWYITYDNFKLYYKPFVEVTFDKGDVESATFVGADNTTIQASGSINLSDYYFTTDEMKVFNGWKDQDGNDVSGTIPLSKDLTLTAQWIDFIEAGYFDEEKGYLVASMDFDKVEVGTEFAIGGLHSITTNNLGVISDKIPASLGLSKNFYLHIGGYGSGNWKATVEGDDSNKYLTLSVVSNDETAGLGAGAEIGRRTVLISTDHNTNSLLPEGEYTLVFDQKHDATRSKNTNTMNSPIRACNWIGYLNEYYGINNPETYTTLADGTSRCVAVANKPHDESFTGYLAFGPAPAPGLVGANGSDFAWYRTYDNFKLYYKPSVEVTFDSGDVENATFVGADNTTIQAIGSINLSDYHFTTTDMKVFKGWKDENGNALSGTINLIRDMVLTADWEDAVDAKYGYLVASMDFDNVEVGTEFAIGLSKLHSITTNNLGVISDKIPADLGLSKNFHMVIGGYGSGWKATVEGDDSNKYLTLSVVSNDDTASLTNGAEIGRRYVTISTDLNANSLLPEGEYTLIFDEKDDATRSKNTTTHNSPIRAFNWNGEVNEYNSVNNPETYTTLADGTRHYVAIANRPLSESFTGYLGFGPAPAPGLVGDNGSDFAWYRTYDNFKLYYKPFVEVTFDSGDVEGELVLAEGATALNADGKLEIGAGNTVDLTKYTFETADPTVKVFDHWADAEGNAVTSINPEEDTTVTAVFKGGSNYATSYQESSIRVNTPAGIRFKASVTTSLKANENLTEYGFIVTTKTLLGNIDVNEFTTESGVTYVSGQSFVRNTEIDKVFEETDDDVFFTAVVYNIPATNYADDLVVRPYTVVNGVKYYGDAVVNNIAAVAQKIKDSNSSFYQNNTQAIEDILAGRDINAAE